MGVIEIIILISLPKHIRPSRQHSCNAGPQIHFFLEKFFWRSMENYPEIILVTPFYLEHSALTLLHSEWPKLHRVLAVLSALGIRHM